MAIVVAGRYVQLLFYFDVIYHPLCMCVIFIKELGELLGRGATSAVFKGKDKEVPPYSSSLFIHTWNALHNFTIYPYSHYLMKKMDKQWC